MFVSHCGEVESNLGVYKHVCNKIFGESGDCARGLQRREHCDERPRDLRTQVGALMVAKCAKKESDPQGLCRWKHRREFERPQPVPKGFVRG